MTCWPTLLHPAEPSWTPLHVPLLGRAFAAIGSKVDVLPGSPNHLGRFLQPHSAPTGLVRHWTVSFLPKYVHISPETCCTIKHECCSWHTNNNHSEGFGFWSLFAYRDYSSRESIRQQLPHFEAIRSSATPPPPHPPPHLSLPDVDVAASCRFRLRKAIIQMVVLIVFNTWNDGIVYICVQLSHRWKIFNGSLLCFFYYYLYKLKVCVVDEGPGTFHNLRNLKIT